MTRPTLSRTPLTGEEQRFFAVEYEPSSHEVVMLDQRLLPSEVKYYRYREVAEVADSIRDMVVRGAPAISIAAAYGVALWARRESSTGDAFLASYEDVARVLFQTRPTAVNLAWALTRLRQYVIPLASMAPQERFLAILREAEAIHREDIAACRAMGMLGAKEVPDGATILTHCNAGALATGGYGTALGVIRAAHTMGKSIKVLASETRPYLQGARLTSWELHADGIDVEVITDNMSGHYFQRGEIDFVVVGSDRIAANGDVANKIGTYTHAVLAHAHDVPFTVAAPWSTVDMACPNGTQIPIEHRSRAEVAEVGQRILVADGIPCRHPAFDVTPARLVRAVYTERGVFRPMQGETPGQLEKA